MSTRRKQLRVRRHRGRRTARSAGPRMGLLPASERFPWRLPDGRWLIWFKRRGEGAGKAFSMLPLPPDLDWQEYRAARRHMRTLPADMGFSAVYMALAAVCGPLMIARKLREQGVPPYVIEQIKTQTAVPEYAEPAPRTLEDGLRVTEPRMTGRWFTLDGELIQSPVWLLEDGAWSNTDGAPPVH